MNSTSARGWVLGSWLVIIGLITAKQVSTKKGLPSPGGYLGASVVYTMLFGLAGFAPSLAAAIGAGTVVGAAVAPYVRGQTTGILDNLANWLASLGGDQGAQVPAQPVNPGGSTPGGPTPTP